MVFNGRLQWFRGTVPAPLPAAAVRRPGCSAWGAGASLRVFGQLSNDTGDVVIRRGGLALVGLSTRYRFTPKTDLTVTVDNLFDRRYYATVDSLFYTPLGEPRRLAATLRHRF